MESSQTIVFLGWEGRPHFPCIFPVSGLNRWFRKSDRPALGWPALVGSHLRTPALKTENFSNKFGRFSKTQKWIYYNALLLIFPGFSVQGMVLVNPFLRFTKTTDFLLKFPVLRARVPKWLLPQVTVWKMCKDCPNIARSPREDTFLLGTPLILYVGILHGLFFRPLMGVCQDGGRVGVVRWKSKSPPPPPPKKTRGSAWQPAAIGNYFLPQKMIFIFRGYF